MWRLEGHSAKRTEVRGRPCLAIWVCRELDVAKAGMQLMSRPELVVLVMGEGGSGERSPRVSQVKMLNVTGSPWVPGCGPRSGSWRSVCEGWPVGAAGSVRWGGVRSGPPEMAVRGKLPRGQAVNPGPPLRVPHIPCWTFSPRRLRSGVQRIWKSPQVCQLGHSLHSVWPEPTSQAPNPRSLP